MYVDIKMADIRGTRGVQAPVLWNVSVHSVITLCIFILTIRTVLAEFKNEDAFRAGNSVTLSTTAAARDLRCVDCSYDCATTKYSLLHNLNVFLVVNLFCPSKLYMICDILACAGYL